MQGVRKVSKKGRVYYDNGNTITFEDTGEVRQKQNFPSQNRNNYNSNNGNIGNNQQQQNKKSSFGFKMMEVEGKKEKMPVCWGFKKAGKGNGIVKLYARPYEKSKISESDTGTKWVNLFVTLTNPTLGTVTKTNGMFDLNQKRLIISDMGLIGTTNGRGTSASGKTLKGYFGKIA